MAGPCGTAAAPPKPVKFAVYAVKLGNVERAMVLLTPLHGKASNLLIVISHSFGQNDTYYGRLGYSNPLSPPLIKDVVQRFVIERWGAQLMVDHSDYALLMPVRARPGTGGGGELGSFVENAGAGTLAIQKLIAMTDGAFALDRVGLVTFSNGITAANQFIAVGGKGQSIHWAINQDPAAGIPISGMVGRKRQFLSGYTTRGQPRPGFEFLPLKRWEEEQWYSDPEWTHDRFNYLHTWCLPHYSLYLGMYPSASA
jgi:hypothetical protein